MNFKLIVSDDGFTVGFPVSEPSDGFFVGDVVAQGTCTTPFEVFPGEAAGVADGFALGFGIVFFYRENVCFNNLFFIEAFICRCYNKAVNGFILCAKNRAQKLCYNDNTTVKGGFAYGRTAKRLHLHRRRLL